MGIEVLGPLTIEGADGVGPRDRVVLQVLVVHAGEYVAPDVLAEALWGERLPASWAKVVQGCIARLRKRLGAAAIETSPYGYRLARHDDLLDVRRFERLVDRARECLSAGEPDRASYLVEEALALWRGRPLPDLANWEPGRTEAQRLEALHQDAQELRLEALIGSGQSRRVLEDVRRLVAEAPLREARWALLARALYQAGRQSEALAVLQRARRMLLDELGLEPGPELVALQESILRQDPELVATAAQLVSHECPYRGLLSYEPEDADTYFGREYDVAQTLRRLRERGVLVVVGASGTGKSSLVRAGLVAALRRDGTRVAVTTPGIRPLSSLEGLPTSGRPPVLVVDQAEEAVTLCKDADERAAYLHTLAAYTGPLVVVLRADFLAELSVHADFAEMVERGLYLLAPMGEDNLRLAVEGPARAAGLRLESGLVDLLVRDVRGEPGALPLLSHALRQTWERREGATLTLDGYRSTGGIRHAVAQSAESLYERLDPEERDQVRSLFLRLVAPSEDGEPVRARVPLARLPLGEERRALVESLVAARLLSSDEGELQIAHEALAREWPRLRDWLEEDVEGQRIFRHLSSAAAAWDSLGRPESELYRGVRLAAARDWVAHTSTELTQTERAFLDASIALHELEEEAARTQLREQRRANRRLRGALVGAAVLLVAAMVAGTLAVQARDRSRSNERRALAALNASDAHRISLAATTGDDPDENLLLAVEANRLEDSPTTRNALLQVLVREPHLVGISGVDHDFNDVSVSPDGSTVAVSSWGDPPGLALVDVKTDKVLATYRPAVARVRYLNSDLIAVGLDVQGDHAAVNPVRLLDATTLKEVPVQLAGQGPPSAVRAALEVSGDGRYLAAGFEEVDDNGNFRTITVRAWDLAHRARPVFTRPGDRFPSVLGVTSRRLFFGADGRRRVDEFDLSSGRRLASVEVPGANGLCQWHCGALAPDGRTLALTIDEDVVLLDTTTLRIARRWTNPEGVPRAPVFSRDSRRLLTMTQSDEGGFTVWSVPGGREVVSAGKFGSAEAVAVFGPDRDRAYVASNRGLMTWQLDRDAMLTHQVPTEHLGRRVIMRIGSPDGRSALYIDSAGARPGNFLMQIQDLDTGRVIASAQYPKVPGNNSGNWLPDGSAVLATQGTRLRRFTLDGATASVLGPDLGIGHLADVVSLGNGRALATNQQGVVVEVDDRSLTRQRIAGRLPTDVQGFMVGYNTDHVVLYDGDLNWWNLDPRTGQAVRLPVGKLWNAAVSPDGNRMAVSPVDGGIGLYDLRRGRWIAKPRSEIGGVITFAPDGRRFVSADGDTVTLWDGRTGSLVASVKVPGAPDGVMPMFRDRHDVMLASTTGELHRWRLDPASWTAEACGAAGRNLHRDEWSDLIGDRPYHRTCSAYPARG